MTQVVTVHTDFTDLNQMAQGLIGRVDPVKVILPGPDSVDAGEWVQFAITLQDGTPGFAGVGRCVTAVDNGEERSSHQRFDVVIDSLQFDSRGQQVFEHILSLSGYAGDAPQPAVEDVNFDDVATEYTGSQLEIPSEAVRALAHDASYQASYSEPESDEDEDKPVMAGVGESALDSDTPLPFNDVYEAQHAEASADEDDEDAFGEPPTGNLVAPAAVAAPVPVVVRQAMAPQTNGTASAGVFAYPDGLPFPRVPPRPTIDPSQRVNPAPRPAPVED